MNDRELYALAKENIDKLKFSAQQTSGETLPYTAKGLNQLKSVISQFAKVPFLKDKILQFKSGPLYKSTRDSEAFSREEHKSIGGFVKNLRIGIGFFIDQFEFKNNSYKENELSIRLPELKTFSDLGKIANDFKKSIEIPLADSKVGGEVLIRTSEPGSIWLIVGVGTIGAVKLIGGIAWAAAVIKKKKSEAKIFEEHAKTLQLKNEELEILINAHRKQDERVLNSEAEAIAEKHYSHNDPETLERLKLSINSISELIDRGAKILPSSSTNDSKNIFPDYDKLNLIESTINKLKGN